MAWQYIRSFSYGGATYLTQWDSDNDAIRTINSSTGSPASIGLLTETELGAPVGTVLLSQCRGTTRVEIIAQTTYPFAHVQLTANAPGCDPAFCDLAITGTTVSDETAAGLHDGSVGITATSVLPILYSIDGTNWQAGNFFFGLAPGTYTLSAKTSTLCQRSRVVVVLPGAVTPVEPDYPSLDRPCHFFRLIYDGVTHDTREPVKWDNANFVGNRSTEWHGYRGLWSDDVIELEFDCPAGKEILELAYNAGGSDAVVLFQYGYSYKGADYVLFPGRINFNTYKRFPQKVSASVEKEDFNQALLTRFETKVSMTDTKGLDGADLTAPAVVHTTLHAKEVVRNFKVSSTEEELFDLSAYADVLTSLHSDYYIRPNFGAATLNEIEESTGYSLQVNSEDPFSFDTYDYKIKYSGTYTFHIEYSMNLFFYIFFGTLADFTIETFLRINGAEHSLSSVVSGHVDYTDYVSAPFSVNHDATYYLQAGDKVFIYTKIHFTSTTKMYGTLKQTAINTTITSLESTTDTACRAWMIYDVINHCAKIITNGDGIVRSKFLALQGAQQAMDGQGALYFLTNGKQIRQFAVDKSPLTLSLKDALTSAKNIFCLGYGIERLGAKDVVRVERVPYFYQNKEIIIIEECYDYSEEVAKELLYNEVETGYEKYQDSGFNTLDEFNTYHQYLTPIKTNKLKATIKSSFIASGYSIEDSRRQQYAETASDSYQNDDETFIISARRFNGELVPEKNEAFASVTGLISPATAYNLRLSPLRMLLNWAAWLKGVFYYKAPEEEIKKTFVAQNGELTTQFYADEAAPVGDTNRLSWTEAQDVDMENFAVEEKIWRPEYIYFKRRLTPDKIQLIDKCMRGAATYNNYGYIVVRDKNGDYQAGWLWGDNCIQYNYATEKATFKLLKKWDSPVQPGLNCCNYLVVNGCYLKVNGLKLNLKTNA